MSDFAEHRDKALPTPPYPAFGLRVAEHGEGDVVFYAEVHPCDHRWPWQHRWWWELGSYAAGELFPTSWAAVAGGSGRHWLLRRALIAARKAVTEPPDA